MPVRAQEDAGNSPSSPVDVDGGIPDAAAGPTPGLDPQQLWGATIADIVLQVPPGIDPQTAEQLFGLRRGDRLDADAVRRGVKRLILLGKMEDVRMWALPMVGAQDAVRVWVQLVRANVIREVRFVGNGDLNAQSLRRGLPVGEADTADDSALGPASEAVRRAAAQEGYPRATVVARFEPLPEAGQVALVFELQRGNPQKTLHVRLEGTPLYPEYKLLDVLSVGGAEMGPGGLASRSRLDKAAQVLTAWYRKEGHYSVRVEALPVPVGIRNRRVPLTLRIHAGPRWVVAFRGNNVFTSRDLKSRLSLPPDRPLDKEVAAQLEEEVRVAYRDSGYLHVKVSLRAAPGTGPGTRRMLFTISEGAYTELRQVTLKGAPGLPRQQLIDEAVLAAEEDLTSDTILQRLDLEDVRFVLSSGDTEAEAWPQHQDARATGALEWPRTPLGRLVDRERVYDEKRFQKGARAMEDLYKSQGYLQPRVQGPFAAYRMDGQQVDVTYTVNSGVQTRIHSLSFRGNSGVESRMLLDVVGQAPGANKVALGAPMDLFAVEEARIAVESYYANAGFPFARVSDDVTYEDGRQKANLIYLVDEGPQVRVKDVLIRGNSVTRNVVIRQQLVFRQGGLFRTRDVEETRRKLLSLGLFSSVSVTLAPEEKGETRTVLVDVRERRFGEGEVRIGASSEQGPRFFAGIGYRNLLGLGVTTGLRFRINWPYPTYFVGFFQNPDQLQKLVSRFDDWKVPLLRDSQQPPDELMRWVRPLLFTELELLWNLGYPRLLFLPFDVGTRLDVLAVRANRLAFTLTKAAAVWTVDMKAPSFKYLRASAAPAASIGVTSMSCEVQLSGQAAADTTGRTCADDPFRLTTRTDNGILALSTLRFPVTLDGRDNIFRPHAGYLATATADLILGGGVLYGGLGGVNRNVRSTFMRLAAGVTGYLPLTKAFTLALGGRVGTLVLLGPNGADGTGVLPNYVPLFERFYLGGSDSVRGFTPDGVIPVDLRQDDPSKPRPLVSQGGTAFWNTRGELRFPIVGPLEGGLFVDAGQLLLDWTQFNPAFLSAGVGGGLRINTPVGPLVLDLGFGILDGVRGLGLQQGDLTRRFVIHPALGYF